MKIARIGRKFLYTSREEDFVATLSCRSGVLTGEQNTFSIIVQMNGEPTDPAPDFPFGDGAFAAPPAIVNDIELR